MRRPATTAPRAKPGGASSHQAAPTGYSPGSVGLDISQYQCGAIPARHYRVAIVQVTGGQLNTPGNPCYAQQAAWAGPNLSAYIFLDGLPNPAPAEARSGPFAFCVARNPACQGYNFGFQWARHWVDYSRSLRITPRLWWLDVEMGAGWTTVPVNAAVIRGAAEGLRQEGVRMGIYSTPYQWAAIAGSLTFPGVPVWTAGAGKLTGPGYTATYYCAAGQAFAGGKLAMVQWGYTGAFPGAYPGPGYRYDQDYACPGG
jgi:hypothetical protein